MTRSEYGSPGSTARSAGRHSGRGAKQALARLAAGKEVTVEWKKRDRYGRIVGKVVYDGKDVDLALVREGMCWWYRKYAHEQTPADRVLYEEAETKARGNGLGLWRDPHPVPPWEWRREQHGR
jgi:micrococcal nuclease